eukprot:6192767-Pleurochrysis_carterae.AAC.6
MEWHAVQSALAGAARVLGKQGCACRVNEASTCSFACAKRPSAPCACFGVDLRMPWRGCARAHWPHAVLRSHLGVTRDGCPSVGKERDLPTQSKRHPIQSRKRRHPIAQETASHRRRRICAGRIVRKPRSQTLAQFSTRAAFTCRCEFRSNLAVTWRAPFSASPKGSGNGGWGAVRERLERGTTQRRGVRLRVAARTASRSLSSSSLVHHERLRGGGAKQGGHRFAAVQTHGVAPTPPCRPRGPVDSRAHRAAKVRDVSAVRPRACVRACLRLRAYAQVRAHALECEPAFVRVLVCAWIGWRALDVRIEAVAEALSALPVRPARHCHGHVTPPAAAAAAA